MQIRRSLPIILNMLICIPLIILAIITYVYSSRMLVNKGENYLDNLVVSEGRALSALVEAKKYQVNIIARDEQVIDILKDPYNEQKMMEVTKYLREALKSVDDYEIAIIDRQGDVIATSTGRNSSRHVKNEEYYKEVLEGKTSFADMLVSYVDHKKTVNITVPVIDYNGQVIGALCKVISNNAFSEFAETVQIGDTGYAFIVSEDGCIIAHPDNEMESKQIKEADLSRVIETKVDLQEGEGSSFYTYDGEDKYGAYYVVDDIKWMIYITQTVSEMQKEAITSCTLVLITLLALLATVYIVCRELTRRITRPIDLLMKAMTDNQSGEFNAFCFYTGDDEFGTLSNTYNDMVIKLGDSHRNLNRVCLELENTKQELQHNYNALEKSKEALVISEERYKRTLDAIDECIWEYNIRTKEVVTTDNLNKVLGMSVEDDITAVAEKIIEPQSYRLFMDKVNKCIRGEVGDFTQELMVTIGEKKWLLCKGHAVNLEQSNNRKLIGILTDITENKVNEEQVIKLSYFDELTGCLNKATFIEGLDGWLSVKDYHEESVLIFIDLDNFKRINDTMGHEIGDKILNYVGTLLREILPQVAFVGRFGGDEFVIFKPSIKGMEEVHELICDILSHFKNQINFGDKKVHITCSMGVAIYPNDGEDSAMLLKNADIAMFKAKNTGKNSYSFYTPSMTQNLDRRLMIEEALREAVSKDSFHLQYQPIIDVNTRKTIGCEALVRMIDSELGFISPDEFIPIAEETDLIIEAGDWVMENALDTLSYYLSQGYDQFYMNINVSSIQIKQPDFLDKLKRFIVEANVPSEFIKLEVTETVLMENVEASIQLFNEVKALGIKIALDDFGTGYSSLNYLRSIPLDILKIDKSFIDEITTSKVLSEIVDSIISMAHALNLVVVAEGVETQSQFEILKEKGCDLIQGYYFSRPLETEQMRERLKYEQEEACVDMDRIS